MNIKNDFATDWFINEVSKRGASDLARYEWQIELKKRDLIHWANVWGVKVKWDNETTKLEERIFILQKELNDANNELQKTVSELKNSKRKELTAKEKELIISFEKFNHNDFKFFPLTPENLQKANNNLDILTNKAKVSAIEYPNLSSLMASLITQYSRLIANDASYKQVKKDLDFAKIELDTINLSDPEKKVLAKLEEVQNVINSLKKNETWTENSTPTNLKVLEDWKKKVEDFVLDDVPKAKERVEDMIKTLTAIIGHVRELSRVKKENEELKMGIGVSEVGELSATIKEAESKGADLKDKAITDMIYDLGEISLNLRNLNSKMKGMNKLTLDAPTLNQELKKTKNIFVNLGLEEAYEFAEQGYKQLLQLYSIVNDLPEDTYDN